VGAVRLRRGDAAREAGFTYLGLMFAIAIIGITLATVGVVWSTQIRRDREAELLFVGDQYREAIGRYYAASGVFPPQLSDLLLDPRMPTVRRYLRRLYPDPMTGNPDWQLILGPGSGIIGVASSSKLKPIKVAEFPDVDRDFEKKECYCDWKFLYAPRYRQRWHTSPSVPQSVPQT
jgi:type II secretory pathway pseudopilin PulG